MPVIDDIRSQFRYPFLDGTRADRHTSSVRERDSALIWLLRDEGNYEMPASWTIKNNCHAREANCISHAPGNLFVGVAALNERDVDIII